MRPGISSGEYLIVLKFLYFKDLCRNDLVVFKQPKNEKSLSVKRVMAVAQDLIGINKKKLTINKLECKYSKITTVQSIETIKEDCLDFKNVITTNSLSEHHSFYNERVVDNDSFFVLGDNRDNSYDSRHFGFISKSDIVGRVIFNF